MLDIQHITSGLQFPEGPIACEDGSVLLVEIKRGTLSRVTPDGTIEVVAETGGASRTSVKQARSAHSKQLRRRWRMVASWRRSLEQMAASRVAGL